jgi:hypothetical protein
LYKAAGGGPGNNPKAADDISSSCPSGPDEEKGEICDMAGPENALPLAEEEGQWDAATPVLWVRLLREAVVVAPSVRSC